MTNLGNHLKIDMPARLRARAREFYVDVLRCDAITSPLADLDLYSFENGFVLGVFFHADESQLLTEEQLLKAAWLEIKTKNVDGLKRKLLKLGVREIEYADTSRFYFQAPGGQVFRVAPIDGGI